MSMYVCARLHASVLVYRTITDTNGYRDTREPCFLQNEYTKALPRTPVRCFHEERPRFTRPHNERTSGIAAPSCPAPSRAASVPT